MRSSSCRRSTRRLELQRSCARLPHFPWFHTRTRQQRRIGDRQSALLGIWLETMAVDASGKRLAALVSSLLVMLACSALMSSDAESINDLVPNAHIFESFDEGWGNRWFHSSDPKYTGMFMTAPTPGSSNAELKASSTLTCYSANSMAVRKISTCVPSADHPAPQVLWPHGSAEQASGPVRGPGDPVRDHLPKGIW